MLGGLGLPSIGPPICGKSWKQISALSEASLVQFLPPPQSKHQPIIHSSPFFPNKGEYFRRFQIEEAASALDEAQKLLDEVCYEVPNGTGRKSESYIDRYLIYFDLTNLRFALGMVSLPLLFFLFLSLFSSYFSFFLSFSLSLRSSLFLFPSVAFSRIFSRSLSVSFSLLFSALFSPLFRFRVPSHPLPLWYSGEFDEAIKNLKTGYGYLPENTQEFSFDLSVFKRRLEGGCWEVIVAWYKELEKRIDQERNEKKKKDLELLRDWMKPTLRL